MHKSKQSNRLTGCLHNKKDNYARTKSITTWGRSTRPDSPPGLNRTTLPPGLNEDVIRYISARKNEPQWLLEWRLEAFAIWQEKMLPLWAHLNLPDIDFQQVSYFSAPKNMKSNPKSLDEVDPEVLATYEKLGIPLLEQKHLEGIAVDAVFDSVSVRPRPFVIS